MKKGILILLMIALVSPLFAREIDAIVTADWLEANLSNPRLAVVDVRKVEDYKCNLPRKIRKFTTQNEKITCF